MYTNFANSGAVVEQSHCPSVAVVRNPPKEVTMGLHSPALSTCTPPLSAKPKGCVNVALANGDATLGPSKN